MHGTSSVSLFCRVDWMIECLQSMQKYQGRPQELLKDLTYQLKRQTEKFYNHNPMPLSDLNSHLKDVVIETLDITYRRFGNFGQGIWSPCLAEVQAYRLLNLIGQALLLNGKLCISSWLTAPTCWLNLRMPDS